MVVTPNSTDCPISAMAVINSGAQISSSAAPPTAGEAARVCSLSKTMSALHNRRLWVMLPSGITHNLGGLSGGPGDERCDDVGGMAVE